MDRKPKRRWLTFSLRSLLVVVTICALVAYWQHREQRIGIVGEISRQDVTEICQAVRNNGFQKVSRIIVVEARFPKTTVRVTTELAPTGGRGYTKGIWTVKKYSLGERHQWKTGGVELSP